MSGALRPATAAPKWPTTGARETLISRLTGSWARMYSCPHTPAMAAATARAAVSFRAPHRADLTSFASPTPRPFPPTQTRSCWARAPTNACPPPAQARTGSSTTYTRSVSPASACSPAASASAARARRSPWTGSRPCVSHVCPGCSSSSRAAGREWARAGAPRPPSRPLW